MSRVGVDQDHQIICKPCILDVGVLAEARGLFRLLQHAVNLGEVEIAEQWRDDPALRNADRKPIVGLNDCLEDGWRNRCHVIT